MAVAQVACRDDQSCLKLHWIRAGSTSGYASLSLSVMLGTYHITSQIGHYRLERGE